MRKHDREHCGAGYRRVYSVTTGLDDVGCGRGSEGVSSHDRGFAPMSDLNRHSIDQSIIRPRQRPSAGRPLQRPSLLQLLTTPANRALMPSIEKLPERTCADKVIEG